MKTTLAVVFSLILGLALGVAAGAFRAGYLPGGASGGRPDAVEVPAADTPRPKAVVEQEHFDFGRMDLHAEGSHDFLIRNEGDAPLRLTAGDTSCRCTLSEVSEQPIPPGQSAKVNLTWHPTDEIGSYRQTATVHTNDPRRPRITLTIFGEVTVAIRTVPSEVVVSQMPSGEPAEADVRLYSYLDQPLELQGWEFLSESTRAYFEAETLPLPEAKLDDEPDATGGLLLRVRIKPGLPPGPFQQRIRLRTNQEAVPTLEIPISGKVVSDIGIVGPGWNDEYGMLDFGTVSRRVTTVRRLLLIARGEHRHDLRFRPKQIDPELLEVTIGEPAGINDGAAVQTPLFVRIPEGSPSVNRLGSEQAKLGKVVLATGHPDTPELVLRVRLAVKAD